MNRPKFILLVLYFHQTKFQKEFDHLMILIHSVDSPFATLIQKIDYCLQQDFHLLKFVPQFKFLFQHHSGYPALLLSDFIPLLVPLLAG